jgi:hypothetical protein
MAIAQMGRAMGGAGTYREAIKRRKPFLVTCSTNSGLGSRLFSSTSALTRLFRNLCTIP